MVASTRNKDFSTVEVIHNSSSAALDMALRRHQEKQPEPTPAEDDVVEGGQELLLVEDSNEPNEEVAPLPSPKRRSLFGFRKKSKQPQPQQPKPSKQSRVLLLETTDLSIKAEHARRLLEDALKEASVELSAKAYQEAADVRRMVEEGAPVEAALRKATDMGQEAVRQYVKVRGPPPEENLKLMNQIDFKEGDVHANRARQALESMLPEEFANRDDDGGDISSLGFDNTYQEAPVKEDSIKSREDDDVSLSSLNEILDGPPSMQRFVATVVPPQKDDDSDIPQDLKRLLQKDRDLEKTLQDAMANDETGSLLSFDGVPVHSERQPVQGEAPPTQKPRNLSHLQPQFVKAPKGDPKILTQQSWDSLLEQRVVESAKSDAKEVLENPDGKKKKKKGFLGLWKRNRADVSETKRQQLEEDEKLCLDKELDSAALATQALHQPSTDWGPGYDDDDTSSEGSSTMGPAYGGNLPGDEEDLEEDPDLPTLPTRSEDSSIMEKPGDRYTILDQDDDQVNRDALKRLANKDPIVSDVDMMPEKATPRNLEQVLSSDAVDRFQSEKVDFAQVEVGEDDDAHTESKVVMSRGAVLNSLNNSPPRRTKQDSSSSSVAGSGSIAPAGSFSNDMIAPSKSFTDMLEQERAKQRTTAVEEQNLKKKRSFFGRRKNKAIPIQSSAVVAATASTTAATTVAATPAADPKNVTPEKAKGSPKTPGRPVKSTEGAPAPISLGVPDSELEPPQNDAKAEEVKSVPPSPQPNRKVESPQKSKQTPKKADPGNTAPETPRTKRGLFGRRKKKSVVEEPPLPVKEEPKQEEVPAGLRMVMSYDETNKPQTPPTKADFALVEVEGDDGNAVPAGSSLLNREEIVKSLSTQRDLASTSFEEHSVVPTSTRDDGDVDKIKPSKSFLSQLNNMAWL